MGSRVRGSRKQSEMTVSDMGSRARGSWRRSAAVGIAAAAALLLAWVAAAAAATGPGLLRGRGSPAISSLPLLRFSAAEEGEEKQSSFKIAIMADLHYGENPWTDWGPQQDAKSTVVQDFVLDAEKPDLVVYLGDLVTANNVAAANASAYWAMATAPAVERSIPFATVFGNHDDMAMKFEDAWFGPSGSPLSSPDDAGYYQGTTRQQLLQSESASPGSLTQEGPKSLWPSLSNYVLTIASAKDPSTAGAFLHFMDSGGGSYPEVLSASQAAWFRSTAESLNPNGKVPELVFFHIPTLAHQELSMKPGGRINRPCIGSLNHDQVAPQRAEWGVINDLTERPSVKAVFSGHNHGLDWCCPREKLWLCFARHTGYGGYGSWMRGARIVELAESPELELRSWIRLENGSTVGELTLFQESSRRHP